MFQPSEEIAGVAVFGLGYVGCVTAACLAKLGHRVIGIDRDTHKVQKVLAGETPFYEPGLEAILQEAVQAGRLTATTDFHNCLESCDLAMICVGTPSEPNGNMSLTQLRRVCEDIAIHLPRRSSRLIVAIRSTVFPGTCEEVVLPALHHHSVCAVVSNPEFLREGTAVQDFLDPSLLVIGGYDASATELVASLYDSLPVKALKVSLRTAEMIKYACNSFHALKIGYANEIGTLCGKLGISGDEVMSTLCADVRLNVSPAYLKPGFAFGGSCLPKDLRALSYRASRLDLSLPLLETVLRSNHAHLARAIDTVLSIDAGRIGIFGLSFKENTDDLRESPVCALVEQLVGKGRDVRVFDPHIRMDEIYGQNRQFALSAVPHIERLMVSSVDKMLESVDQVILTQKPSADYQSRIDASGKPVMKLFDLSYSYVPAPPMHLHPEKTPGLRELSRVLERPFKIEREVLAD